jgi:hypothetical protein
MYMMGPGGAVTGLHSDDEDNVLLQICGKKRVVLFPPSSRHLLRPNQKYDSGKQNQTNLNFMYYSNSILYLMMACHTQVQSVVMLM